jgi:hypothetical protein
VRRTFLTWLLVVAALMLGAAVATGVAAGRDYFHPCSSQSDQPPRFTHYYVGTSFEGLVLHKTDYGSCGAEYDYGECPAGTEPEFEDTCERPLVVETSSVCGLNTSELEIRRATFRGRLRGVPAIAFLQNQLTLYTGDVAVFLQGEDGLIRRAARALAKAPTSARGAPPRVRLPRPVRGAVTGTLNCGLRFSHVAIGRPRPCRVRQANCYLIPIEVKLKRAAHVQVDFARHITRKPDPGFIGWRVTDGAEFDAKPGVTRDLAYLGRGRYDVAIQATSRPGRHTSHAVFHIRVPAAKR